MTTSRAISAPVTKTVLFDLLALVFIYFVPALSHMLALPVYFIEPMRLVLILAMVHTNRRNAYLIALTLPLFSFLVSAHPAFYKMGLISLELVLNVWLFYFIADRMKNKFVSMTLAIIGSKLVYYLMKYLFISVVLIEGSLISTPIWFQFIMIGIFSGYAFFLFGRKTT